MKQEATPRSIHVCARIAVVAAVGASMLSFAPQAEAQDTLFIADVFMPTFNNGYLRRMNTDGTGLSTISSIGGGLRGVAVDPYAEKIYWSDVDSDVIRRANLNGSGAEDILTEGMGFTMAIDFDLLNGKLYWSDTIEDQIGRCNLDGSDPEIILETSVASGLAVDMIGGKIYWSASYYDGNVYGMIHRANLDGTGMETVVTGHGAPADIVVDAAGGKVYWTDYVNDVVRRANLDGTVVEDIYIVGANLNPGGIALDLPNGKVYWGQDTSSSPHEAKIMRANLDGTGVEDMSADDDFGLVTHLDLPTYIPGDLDIDQDVDLDDYLIFFDCITGPNVPTLDGCETSDLDYDNDVDLKDFSIFQAVFPAP